ncbi:MAG: alpha/beta hydrolase [Bacteroidales bacterium]|nr:alpha/beta hydrolase [Bacteroidales bacterium]
MIMKTVIKRKQAIIGFIAFVFLFPFSLYFIKVPKSSFFEQYLNRDQYYLNMQKLKSEKIKSITLDDVNWNYYSLGSGSRTILFLHGMGGVAEIWWNQIMEFKKTYRVIAFTLPEEIKSLSEAEEGIMLILSHENVDQFYTVGSSMGGYLAQYLVEKHPHRVVKAVFGNTFPPNNFYKEENKTKRKLLPFVPEYILWQLGKVQLKKTILPAAENSVLLKSVLYSLPFSKKQFIGRYDIVVDYFTAHSDREDIRLIPKLIIESDNDPLVNPLLRKQLKNLYSDAKVYTFQNKGHFPYVNASNEYNEILHAFLD